MDMSWSEAANRNLICFFITWFLLAGCGAVDGQKCRFPVEWKGRWWQSGLGDVIMRDSSMSTKGQCHEHHRDYYLLYNRERQCYQCLLIMERHRNLIQYKESFCSDEGSLEKICQLIRVESPLYSLVREPNAHIRCPFHDAYYFNYNDHHTGFCDNPLSYAKPCVGNHQYQLHFQHCVDHAELNGRDLELECLATWKEGSDTYLYGRFSGPGILNKDSAYRCFKYDYEGNQLFLSMSLDPTCRGLRSARDGPVIFKFTKDLNGWPPPVCQFPEWFRGENWRDIEGRNSFELDDKSREIMGYYRKRINSKSHMKYQFRCMEVIEDDIENQQMTFLSFSTHRCVSKHQCIRLRKIKDGVVEMFQGSLVDYDGNARCLQVGEYHTRQILIPDGQPLTPCPSPGFYDIQPSVKCMLNLDIGCSNSSSIELLTSCLDDPDYFHISCLAWWQSEDRTFIIAQDKMAQSRLYNCFSIRQRGAMVEFGVDNNCNRGIPNLYDSSIRHTISALGHCSAKPVRPTPRITTPRATEPTTKMDEIDIVPSSHAPTKPPSSTIYSEDDFNFVDGANPNKDQSGWMQDSDRHPVVPDPDNYPYLPENKDDPDDSEEESSAKISIESTVDHEGRNELSSGDGRPPTPDDPESPASSHSSSVSRSTNSAQALHCASSVLTVLFILLLNLR